MEDPVTGRLKGFRRGVTRFPVPGTRIFPVTQDDMEQIFSAFERPHISIGTVYPSQNVRASLYVDALLGKHFALLGSTGRSEEHTSELQSLMRNSYAVFC